MKMFEIHCIILDKNDLSNLNNDITEIILITVIKGDSVDHAESSLKKMYTVKEMLSIMEIV